MYASIKDVSIQQNIGIPFIITSNWTTVQPFNSVRHFWCSSLAVKVSWCLLLHSLEMSKFYNLQLLCHFIWLCTWNNVVGIRSLNLACLKGEKFKSQLKLSNIMWQPFINSMRASRAWNSFLITLIMTYYITVCSFFCQIMYHCF